MVPHEALYLQSSGEGPLPHIFPMSSFLSLLLGGHWGVLYPEAVQPLGERGCTPSWCPEGQTAAEPFLAELVRGCCPLLSACSIAASIPCHIPPAPPFIPVGKLVCKLGHLAQGSEIKGKCCLIFLFEVHLWLKSSSSFQCREELFLSV